jgi:hypothetical protein
MYVSPECAGLQIALNRAPPDLAETFLQAARAKGMPRRRLMAGDITFMCTIGDRRAGHGRHCDSAAVSGQSGLWYSTGRYG